MPIKTRASMNKKDSQLEKRRLKFSQGARDAILQDHLRDSSLLSRSDASNSQLQTNQLARENLLAQLQSLENSDLLEHGLRKLREVIVSIFEQCKGDGSFLKLVRDTYNMSYNLFLKQRQFFKLGGTVLGFMATNFPESRYRQLYALYASHVESDLNKCVDILIGNPPSYTLNNYQSQLLRLSCVYVENVDCPSHWFQILSSLSSQESQFLTCVPAYSQMTDRCFQCVQKCYNQIPVDFLLSHWFHGMATKADIPSDWQLETGSPREFLVFRKSRRH